MNLPLTGTSNFRSLKGLPTLDGRRIAEHTVLRSDQLDRLRTEDWLVLRSLRVKTVCDLRSPSERNRYPNNLPPGEIRQVSMTVMNDVRADPRYAALLQDRPSVQGAVEMMLEIYRCLPTSFAPHLPALFQLFGDEEVPVLIHCAAGKDRTGFVVAVVLHALGVTPDSILADYIQSASTDAMADINRREMVAKLMYKLTGNNASDAVIDAILDARPAYLQAALDNVTAQYGSMSAYLEIVAGLDAAALQCLRDRWLM
jgi:protein-tyrosine phosphatase